MSVSFWLGILQQGLLFGVMVLGVYITFRILDYADLTVEGSFTLGAAVVSTAILKGIDPIIGTFLAFVSGGLAGVVTGFLHTKLKITPLLSGILTMTGLYSINLRIMGKANLSLLRQETLISKLQALGLDKSSATLILGLITVVLAVVILNFFLKTELGLALRATGDNEDMIRSLGVNTDFAKILGLALSNALVSLAGAEIAQLNNFADVNMGIGMIVMGLASVIIGEVLFGSGSFPRVLIAVVLGSVVYRAVVGAVLSLGLPATDLKVVSAILVVIALASPKIKTNFNLGFRRDEKC